MELKRIGWTDRFGSGVITDSQIECMEGGMPEYERRLREGQTCFNIPVYMDAAQFNNTPSSGA